MNIERILRVCLLLIVGAVILLILGCTSIEQPKDQEITRLAPIPSLVPLETVELSPSSTATPTADIESPSTITQTPTPQTQVDEGATPLATPATPSLEQRNIGPFIPLENDTDRQSSIVEKLLNGPDGHLWVVGADNVTSYDGEKWLFHGEITGHTLGFDGLDRLWIVDEDGEWISAYDGRTWVKYGPEQGWLPAGWMYNVEMYGSVSDGIITDLRGDTWLVTIHDVRVLRDDHWTLFAPEDVGYEPSSFMLEAGWGFMLNDVALDATGDVWVTDCAWMGPGPDGQGARWYDGVSWSGQSSPVVASGCIKDVEVCADGRIWAGVDDEVWRYTQGSGWKLLPHPVQFPIEGMRWGWIIDLLLDGTDAAWVTMVPCGGASCDSGQSITFWVSGEEWLVTGENTGENGLPDVALGGNDLTWGCFSNGLYQVAGGEFIPVDATLPGTCQVEADKTGRVWLAIEGESQLWVFDAP